MSGEKIAVYGTLRRGEGKLGKLKNSSLVYPGHQTFPAVIHNNKGKGTVVEVRDVSREQLLRYDMYEGVSSGLYRRIKADIDMEDGTQEKAWVYVAGDEMMQRSNSFTVIQSGDWYNR
jgi:gamma-glutamylcyclotransferase (GGCT)/AIG2-like uncharacterized protein YtfP|tara:strand:+ start:87 stop:440 length:354 start_codon:yes stop_codon:yes gene_type:complete